MKPITYSYKPKPTPFILAVVFFGLCAFVLAYKALGNDRGLILNRIIEFSANGATIFYWCLTVASGIFVLFGLKALMQGSSGREVVLAEKSISAPKSGISNRIVSVDYADIIELSTQSAQGQHFLKINHSGGKLTIPNSMLPDKESFEQLVGLLKEKIRSNGI